MGEHKSNPHFFLLSLFFMSAHTKKVDDGVLFTAESIASLCLSSIQPYSPIQLSQTKHRLNICQQWKIPSNSSILEIGCGHGDCTAVLASFVDSQGHVTALDPGDASYGSPFTLGQAQTHLRKSSLGSRLTFIQDNPIHFLQTTNNNYDYAIFFHSVWYFSSANEVEHTFRALHGSTAHLLSVLLQAACNTSRRLTANVRTVLSKKALLELACKAGWTKVKMEYEVKSDLDDGRWEVEAALDLVQTQEKAELICALRDALLESLEQADNLKDIPTLNVWSSMLSSG